MFIFDHHVQRDSIADAPNEFSGKLNWKRAGRRSLGGVHASGSRQPAAQNKQLSSSVYYCRRRRPSVKAIGESSDFGTCVWA